ncbi:MAG TPA: hypothetical protein VLF18_11740, partial [Tahibacter sp.]|uniref:DUF7507 domain-containing protein n=1 Tax=Tahibacter sp. TaxID=2056211 RepID=UPI002CD214E4
MFALIGAIVGLALGGSEALAQPGTNLALGAPVTMSSTAAGSAAANCVDGTAGDFCLTGVSGTNGIANQWVDVDLLGDHPIERIVLDNTGATCCRSTDRWLLIVSGDSSLPRPANPAAVYANARYYRLAYANGANGTTGAASSVNGGTAAGATWTTLTIPTGLRKAAWIRVFQLDNSGGTGNGQLGFNEIRVIQGAPFQRYLVNGGFETPGSGGALGVMRANGTTPGWSTTDQFNAFENWNRGPAGSAGPYDFPAFEGSTLIELNAWTSGTVSQSICVFPGESFQWSLAHHVRNPAPIGPTAPDVAKLTIDGADIAQFSDNSIRNATAASDHACTLLAGAAAASATCSSALAPPFTSDANGWGHWRGAWSNTNAVPKKVTFEVGAVTSASGSISAGNFLDAFDLAGLATVVTFSSASSSGPETIPGANLPVLTLSGVLAADSSVDIAFGGTAVLGQHYSTSTGTATVTVPIPAGTYDGTAATGIPLTPYLQILSDGPVHSPPDVLRMTLANFGAGIKLGNGQTCSPGSNPLDYTIFDIRPQLSLQKSTPTTTLVPNGTVTYTVTASNIGSVDGGGTVIADAVPAGISAFGWTCTASGGAACPNASGSGAISETVASFPAGGTLVYTIAATVAAVPPASLSNTATATLADADCAPGNSPSPCVATAVIAARPAIRIDKGTPDTVASPGGTVNYAVNLTNAGSAGVTAASPFTFSDALPAGVTAFGWTCQAFGGAVCPVASGSGAISATITTMPRGSRLTYSIQAAVAANPPASVVNTAQITAPAGGGTCAQNGNADPCADSVALPAAPKIRVNKTTSTTSLVAGGTVDYTVVVTNAGNVAANGTTVSDAIPAGLTTPFTWTCTAASGAACPNASGSGEIAETIATLPAGGSVSFAIAATVVSPAAPTLVTNTARATPPPGGVCAPANSAPPCTAAAALSPVPIMSLQKTASTAVLVPNANVVFTLLARNVSDRGADGTTIADAVPAGLAFTSWTCSGSGGATCTTASGSGAVNQVAAAFPPGGEIIHTIHATVSASPPASITNTASGTPANNGACFPNNTAPPCTSAVTLTRPPSVSITKTSSATAVVPNGTITYEIVVTNTGTSSAAGTLVNDPVPAGITSFAWTCAASGGAACAHASGSGGIGETALVFPAGGSLTYTVTAVTSANPPASITNTARATPPNQGTCSPSNTQPPCAASVSTPPVPVLDLQKTTSSAVLTPGGTVVYAITVGNAGFVPADGSVVSDPIPAGLTTPFTWTCSAANGAVCPNASGSGAIAETIATLPADGSLDYTVTATVAANPPALIDNVVTAQPPASGGLCAPDNAAPPCRANVQRPAAAIVQLHKSTTAAQATPGGTVTYSVVVTNPGNADAGGTTVSDPIPAGLTTPFTWTCTASGGAVCAAGGSGALNDTLPAFPAGATATYTITATVADAPPASVTNTAAATPAPGGVCAPGNTPPPCTSAATVPAAPTISVQKSTSDFFATPSGTLTYTVVVSNTGSVPADGTTVGDPLPAGLTAFDWTCTASGGAACTAAGSGALADTIAPFPPGSVATYTITAAVDAAPPAQITNTASATPVDGVCAPANTAPPCASTTTTPTVPRISVAKTANTDVLTPGGTVVYTVAVGNAGAVAATNVLVSDPMPAGIAAFDWTCAGTACPNPAGTGAISQTIAALPAGASVVYTVTATVGAAPPAQITNTVSVDPPDAVCAPGNTPPPCSSSVSTPPGPQVSVTKTADTTVLTPGGTVTYTIIVNNAGSVAAPNTVVGDPVPPGIATFDWTCASAGGAICPNASGSGAINETIATLPAAANVTYTVAASVSATPPEQITNTASASPPGGLCVPGNTPPPCSSSVSTPPGPQIRVTKTADTATLTPGGTINYTVTVTNTGSVAAPNTAVSDPVPAGITAFAWSCSAAGGAVCPAANGTGAVNAVIATLP